jgi:hypothetical protein
MSLAWLMDLGFAASNSGAPAPVVATASTRIRTIDPRYMDVVDWCDLMVQNLGALTDAPQLLNAADWQVWATSVVSSPEIRVLHPPDPRYFESWQEWAFRFNQAVSI